MFEKLTSFDVFIAIETLLNGLYKLAILRRGKRLESRRSPAELAATLAKVF